MAKQLPILACPEGEYGVQNGNAFPQRSSIVMANFVAPLLLLVALVTWPWPGQGQATVDSDRSLPLEGDDPLEERLIEGMDEGIKHNYRGAIAIFTELILLNPSYGEAYFNRGIARAKLQDYQGAIADQSQAILLDGNLAEAYQARGRIYWQLGQSSLAIGDLKRALALFEARGNTISAREVAAQLGQWQNP